MGSPGEWLTRAELIAKLHRKSEVQESGCIEWQGTRLPKGYGRIAIGKQKQAYAHRISYQVHNGPVPADLCVCHRCDNPSCVNPEHLFLGTRSDNMKDCSAKKRTRIPVFQGSANNKAKLTEQDVLAIRASSNSRKELASQYQISEVMISYILNRKNWRHV